MEYIVLVWDEADKCTTAQPAANLNLFYYLDYFIPSLIVDLNKY